MLSCSNILPSVFAFVTIGGCFLSSTDALYNNSIRPERLPPFVRFSNPDMMSSDVGDGSSFPFDTTQEDADPLKLGGIRLREEAKKLSARLRRLSNEEMGITTMQVRTNQKSLLVLFSRHNFSYKSFARTKLET